MPIITIICHILSKRIKQVEKYRIIKMMLILLVPWLGGTHWWR